MLTNVKPRPGERVTEYLARVAAERLRRAGASDSEASDLAEVALMHFDRATLEDWPTDAARAFLEDWRRDRRELAAMVRENRRARLEAGYRSVPVSDPVHLNGSAVW